MIVTLAGHVDHGKTSLVRALTGVDTDRLEEEKRRGLTIDLGFAYREEGDVTLGFVDVPGHHRFIHNMVAGVAAMQHALLVVAADDGPMPQSREYLQILGLLGIREGVVALTKCDRVSAERIEAARDEIRALVAGSFLEGSEIIETSTESGSGLTALADALQSAARRHAQPSSPEPFRLPIDRAFTVAGVGVVVTGTVHAGAVHLDESLAMFPSNAGVRVKSIHTQNRAAKTARVGDRCALNLAGVGIEDVSRGDWLSALEEAPGSREFSLTLEILEDFPRALRHWLPVHVYHATSHTTAHVALLAEGRLEPGQTALVELVADTPLLLGKGDRLIVRDQGLERTLGGGTVVAVQAAPGRRRDVVRVQRVAADAAGDAESAFAKHLTLGAVELAPFQRNWQLSDAELTDLVAAQGCRTDSGHAIADGTWRSWREGVKGEIVERHTADRALQGIKQSELKTDTPALFLNTILNELVHERELSVRAGRFLPAEHEVALSRAEEQTLSLVLPLLDETQPASLGDLSKRLRIPIKQLVRSLHPLVSKKRLVRISDTRYYVPRRLDVLAALAKSLSDNGPFTVRDYRDAAKMGRNVVIEVLEYFDRCGYTRRSGDVRSVVGDVSRLQP